ncbi:flagellar motor stator protein MotA [Govanella unica]|uniref:Flagellar motor stator protein MotA n=1 Tax=Govanella unica TaxID=2975056 RepID=A0A9X3Z7E6_9PROT|nr:flagellar motor stator protein MotA [Govania unica]MDA5194072.1 flagellar motor stator protein MotA [Govania unica]
MLSIVGLVLVLVAVFGGYIFSGGKMEPILHALPHEMIVIGGGATAAFLVANSVGIIKGAGKGFTKVFKGPKWKSDDYRDLLSLLFMLTKLVKTKGVIALEQHIEHPEESKIFNHFSKISSDHHVVVFICDYLRMMTMNFDDAYQVEDVMQKDLEKHHAEVHGPAHALAMMAEGLPAIGIVAAVMGIVKTMGSISQPVEILGAMIGGALVGTFLGIFLSYLMVGPIATRLGQILDEEGKFFNVIKDTLVSHLHGNAPQISVEIGRKSVPSSMQPSFYELDEAIASIPPELS